MENLVLIPGLGSDATVWSVTIDALGGAMSCTVGDTLRDSSLPDMARRILSDAPASFFLAGVSMGGMIALEIMRAEPHRVKGLVMVDSNASPDTPEQTAQRRQGLTTLRTGVDLRTAAEASLVRLVHPRASAEVRRAIVEMSLRVGAETYARQMEAVLNRPDQRPVLATLNVPTLVIMGADDVLIPLDCAHAIVAAVAGAELEIIPGCGHLPPIEKPQAVAELIRRFVSRAPASESNREHIRS